MATKTLNEITLDMLEYLRTSFPEEDIKPGTVARDLFVDLPSSQLSALYNEISSISDLQSLRNATGINLIRLARNLGAEKRDAVAASGRALLTFSSLNANVGVSPGEVITAQNGISFTVVTGVSVEASKSNFYRAIATKYASDLAYLGITDQFAVEVSVRASVPGSSGNISKYSLVRTAIAGVSNVSNVSPFSGGADQEDDNSFRNRVLAIFSGSNVGTALGYRNAALTAQSVLDALVISPGDTLMTRDGTITSKDAAGNVVITSEGTGNKVDVVVLGTDERDNVDTFIYRDKSNNSDPTSQYNDFVLGQIAGDELKSISRKRIDNLLLGELPAQPVQNLFEVSGSQSGGNFSPKNVDEFGRVTGNYEIVKDTGVYGGSAWAQDKFHWVSDRISNFPEDNVKGQYNGQDSTSFSDVIQIPKIEQNIQISNENSNVVVSDRSIIQLLHTPVSSVSRVVNTNTGERYTVIDQNFDDGTPNNKTGRIQISGNTLPSTSDILQVDYIWVVDYDSFSDYDGKISSDNPRVSSDSIDWGVSNVIRDDESLFTLSTDGTVYSGQVSQPISSIISASSFRRIWARVSASSVVNFSDRLAITLSSLEKEFTAIQSISIANGSTEVYRTASNDGLFINNRIAVGTQIRYNVSIILPTDTSVEVGDYVEITYNEQDVFNVVGSSGNFIENSITIPAANIIGTPSQVYLSVDYIAATTDLLSYGITNMPIAKLGNGYSFGTNFYSRSYNGSNIIQSQNQTVQKDSSNEYYVTIDLSSAEYSVPAADVVSILNTSTMQEYWNKSEQGTVSVDSTTSNFKLTLSGVNSPAVGDRVIVIFSFSDLTRTQPFSFSNEIVDYSISSIDYDFDRGQFYSDIKSLSSQSDLSFTVTDASTGAVIGSATDGYTSPNDGYGLASISSSTFNFSTLIDPTSKLISIDGLPGSFHIASVSSSTTASISLLTSSANEFQISVIRLSDNKEIWNPLTCSIEGTRLYLPASTTATAGNDVLITFLRHKPLHQSPTRLAITLSDQINNNGVLTISGKTVEKVSDIVFTATQNGLKQNLFQAIRKHLSLPSTSSIEANKSVIRVLKLDKVLVDTSGEVISVVSSYDVRGSHIRDNSFYSNLMNYDSSLSQLEFILPSTLSNASTAPVVGDSLRISFYYATNDDSENVYFSRNGTLYTNKKFLFVNRIFASSGFNASSSARFTISTFTQPATGTRYRAFYDYLAPKQNERILIRYNYNNSIADATFAVEKNRPINADVLVRAAKTVEVDVTVNVVVKSEYATSTAIVMQNVKDRISSAINTNILGDVVNASDIVSAVQGVDGVDRARVIYFNKADLLGQVLTLVANKDEYFVANDVEVNQESR